MINKTLLLVLVSIGFVMPDDLRGEKNDYFNNDARPMFTPQNSAWMKNISKYTFVSRMSIPGTHNTCARYGGSAVECQSWSLADQLNAGIRFVDIRCRYHDGDFSIHHGKYYQRMNFTDVWTTCRDFLADNPSECIVMNVQDEDTPDDVPDAELAKRLRKYMDHDPSLWLTTSLPMLCEARGKIAIISKGQLSATKYGPMVPASWPEKATVQNEWKIRPVTGTSAKEKRELITKAFMASVKNDNQLRQTRANGKPYLGTIPDCPVVTWTSPKGTKNSAYYGFYPGSQYINFLSGENIPGGFYPKGYAKDFNGHALKWLNAHPVGAVGIVPMDFPGQGLINEIIARNFRNVEKKRTLTIQNLQCLKTTESGSDEIYLRLTVDGKAVRLPSSGSRKMKKKGDTVNWAVGYQTTFKKSVKIAVWEDDSSSADDRVGVVDVNATVEGGGYYQFRLKESGEYLLKLNVELEK